MKKNRRPAAQKKTASRRRVSPSAPAAESDSYVLKLFVAGTTPRSALAVANLRAVCDQYLAGRHELEVVDIYQDPARAAGSQIVAIPTLLKIHPGPTRCVVGDLSDRKKMLLALNLTGDARSVA